MANEPPQSIIGIDPGPRESGLAVLKFEPIRCGYSDTLNTADLLEYLRLWAGDLPVAYEWITCYGKPVGADVFETCYICGLIDAALPAPARRIERREAKRLLCNSVTARDTHIRQALLDRFAPSGGGKIPQIGTKAARGPLHGVTGHAWSALAIAVTYHDLLKYAGK